MSQGYRDELGAAQARIAELEGELARGAQAVNLDAVEREHAALVRSVPTTGRVRLMFGLAAIVALTTLASMLFLSSPYDSHPRFTIALQMFVMCSIVMSAAGTWVSRAEALRRVALSERLLAAERARAALESRVRIAEPARIAEIADEAETIESSSSPLRAKS